MGGILDIVALRSLTSIADAGGFRRAAAVLHLSQSAVSQHVRRLEAAVGRPLVQRTARATSFTPAGELLLAEARTILAAHDDALELLQVDAATPVFTIGSTEHAADRLLPAITARLERTFPDHVVRYRIDRGRALHDRLEKGTLDAALFIGEVRARRVERAGALPLSWFAAPGAHVARGGLPLVAIDEPCTIRRRALQSLAEHAIPATVVCEAGHLAGVVQAARAGLGVALLAHLGPAPEGLEERHDLPPVAPEPLHVRGRNGATEGLVAAVARAAADVLPVDAVGAVSGQH